MVKNNDINASSHWLCVAPEPRGEIVRAAPEHRIGQAALIVLPVAISSSRAELFQPSNLPMSDVSRCGVVSRLRTIRAAGWLLFQNASDRPGAETTAHQAAEAIVNLCSRVQVDLSGADNIPDLVITDDVAGADDHSKCTFWSAGALEAVWR